MVRTTIVALLLIAAASSASALERTTARVLEKAEVWQASSSYDIRYYNTCTGWTWVWSGWEGGEEVGVVVNRPPDWAACGEDGQGTLGTLLLDGTWIATRSGVPSGYGFTGTISVRNGQGCSGGVLASQPFLPAAPADWHFTDWGRLAVADWYTVVIQWATPSGYRNPTQLYSDHPAAGPTGPEACGMCYPTTRSTATRYYGVNGSYCPSGVGLSDGVCDVELLVECSMGCFNPVGVGDRFEERSWGQIKGLYR